jgi:hypothetical protein
MFVIRETFTAKPGMASKLASLLTEAVSSQARQNVRVLTDFVGPFNTVVMETEVEDIGEFEGIMKESMGRKDIRDTMKGYTDLYQSGRREIYQIVPQPANLRR